MKNVSYQTNGKQLLVFIENDTHEEAEAYFNMFWNWKATSSEPNWLTDTCASFWTSQDNFMKALTNIELMRILRDTPSMHKGKKGGSLELAKKRAIETFAGMERKTGYIIRNSVLDPYELGVIAAEKIDEFSNDKEVSAWD